MVLFCNCVKFSEKNCVVEWRVPAPKKKGVKKATSWEVFDAKLIRISGQYLLG